MPVATATKQLLLFPHEDQPDAEPSNTLRGAQNHLLSIHSSNYPSNTGPAGTS